jgi:hypothetical protein
VSFRGGIFVSAVDSTNGDAVDAIVVGAGPGGTPEVIASYIVPGPHPFRGHLAAFPAYDPRFLSGVRVAAADLDGDGAD